MFQKTEKFLAQLMKNMSLYEMVTKIIVNKTFFFAVPLLISKPFKLNFVTYRTYGIHTKGETIHLLNTV